MRKLGFNLTGMAILLVLTLEGCSSKSAPAPTPPAIVAYVLTVNSTNSTSGAAITASPVDNYSKSSGTSSFTLSYNAGTSITLAAAATAGSYAFSSWTGCTITVGSACIVILNASTAVTANYSQPSIHSVTVTPTTGVTIGSAQQFTANVAGSGSYNSAVTWSLAAPAGSAFSPGTLTPTGLYTTPYPAPASVTISAAANETAKVYLYSNANLSSIVAQTPIAVTTTASGTTSTITTTFPAQSITLFIVP